MLKIILFFLEYPFFIEKSSQLYNQKNKKTISIENKSQ